MRRYITSIYLIKGAERKIKEFEIAQRKNNEEKENGEEEGRKRKCEVEVEYGEILKKVK